KITTFNLYINALLVFSTDKSKHLYLTVLLVVYISNSYFFDFLTIKSLATVIDNNPLISLW
ncbi:MAG: hypothetical protein PHG42_01995, partial [Bacteroides sp.]|nr:hypothetical protein [Bacteroides sp.]